MEILCNFNKADLNIKEKIGLAIPVFKRPEYLRACLDSLKQSDLDNTIVCIIDESTANDGLVALDGYRLHKNLDSMGYDIKNVWKESCGKIEEVKKWCDASPQCVGFNTHGWLKYRISPSRELRPIKNTVFGLYLKKEAAHSADGIRQCAQDDNDGQTTVSIIKSFSMTHVPIIKIIKDRHGNMYDSLKIAWDMLTTDFGCTYLACLDSDTVVKKDWLKKIWGLYRTLKPEMANPYLITTGFNTNSHPSLSEHNHFNLKSSLGGINMFFHKEIYHPIRQNLCSVAWDDDVSQKILRMKGKLACTRPSVIQHMGKTGMWSNGTVYDFAEDFRAE